MFRKISIAVAAITVLALTVSIAAAGSAHYTGNPNRNPTVTEDGNTLLAEGKVAGLGNIPQITVRLTADAACINPGGNKPKAANKETFSTDADVPVQNGKAEFSISLTATFQPNCSPPMTVDWSNITISVDGFPELTRTFP